MRTALPASLLFVIACQGDKPPADGKAGAEAIAKKGDAAAGGARIERRFDEDPVGPPPGLELLEASGAGTPAKWTVVADESAPSPKQVLALTENKNPKTVYSLALVEGASWKDLDATVMVRAVAGANNQGGGIAFRAKGANDHYVARWNPLENNVRLYALIAGGRIDIVAKEVVVDGEGWHALRVVAEGPAIQVFLDDQPVLSAQDETFAVGRIGLWVKGDADTRFDDFTVSAP